MSHHLTEKQEFFCREYIIDLNATQAAIRAGYSNETAGSIGHENLQKPEIQKRLAKLKDERAARLQITADRVLQELARIAFVDLRDVTTFGPGGVKVKQDSEISPDNAAAICEVTQTITEGGGSIKIKMHSKEKALELLSRHVGILSADGPAPGVTIINVTPQLGEKKLETAPKPLSPEDEARLAALLIPKDAPASTPIDSPTKEGESAK